MMQNWIAKACNMLSATWRSQGAPESDETATEDFLHQLSMEYAARANQNGVKPDWPTGPSQQTTSVTVDEEGFDCRIGKRAQKRRREAKTVADFKQKPAGAKGGASVLHKMQSCVNFGLSC